MAFEMICKVLCLVLAIGLSGASPVSTGPCYYDGAEYQKGDVIMIPHCLGSMVCLGNNNYGNLTQFGGICPDKRSINGQTGCLFDGKVYAKGEKIIIQPCLAEMTCEGNNGYSQITSLGGVCPDKRNIDGQTGCLFDGKVYTKGEKIIIQPCLAEMTCEGNNGYSKITSLGGQC